MGDIVSLKLKRKDKARAIREADAAANRAKYGRTKEEKQRTTAEDERARQKLDGHKRGEE
jgi:hypothetical protein